MKIFFLSILIYSAISVHANSQSFATWDNQQLILDNGLVKRVILLKGSTNNCLTTTQFVLKNEGKSYFANNNDEFFVELNGEAYTGKNPWQLEECTLAQDTMKGNGATITLKAMTGRAAGIKLRITYLLYPDLPIVKKTIAFDNEGKEEICIESLDVEKLITGLEPTYTWICNSYGRYKTINGYEGDYYDPVVVLHDVAEERGIVLGNEAPGVTKKITAMLDGSTITIGLNHASDRYPLRKYLKPGDKWTSPATFIGLYHESKNPYDALNGMVSDYVRKYMGARIFYTKNIPAFIYNTWVPFRDNLTASSVLDIAENAAQCGFSHFVIDAGWHSIDTTNSLISIKDKNWTMNLGDWLEDSTKFPNGLAEVFEKVRKMGMNPGLWISVATANTNSKVYREHPDWFVKDENGNPAFLHDNTRNPNAVTACLAGPYYDYIKNKILKLTRELGLTYVKLDLSIVTSAYCYNVHNTGCFATNHAYHKDHEESYIAIYERCFQLFDELHREAPGLFIDCTFETMGKLQLIDFAMLKHAEGNWLTNIEETAPDGSWRMRQMAWWRSPVIPASSMIIGNLILDDPNYYQSLLSLSGSMPIMLGDTRKLTADDKRKIKEWADWMKDMQTKYKIMNYRQDLPGFDEPKEGSWDGFSRINSDNKTGGIVGVFRQGAAEIQRTICVNYLDPLKYYEIRRRPSGEKIAIMNGNDLANKGFPVTLEKKYDGCLFEIGIKP